MEGNADDDLAIGDCASIVFSGNYSFESITSTSTDIGGADEISMGDGNDIAIGGYSNDTIYGSSGTNILVGDSALIVFHDKSMDDGTRVPKILESINCTIGNVDLIFGGNGTDYIIGGAQGDVVHAYAGDDLAIGDCASIVFSGNYSFESITSTSTDIGGADEISMGDGNDIAIGGYSNDTIYGSSGTNILVGDSALVVFHTSIDAGLGTFGVFFSAPKSIESIDCQNGDDDFLVGGNGTDYIIGGAQGDEVHALGGSDFVFGDHGKMFLYKNPPFKLLNATTTDASCSPGQDRLLLGDGADIAFGGALGDTIDGGSGQDIILGDFGLYRDQVEFLPNQFFQSITDFFAFAGPDMIDGGPDDDILMGQEYDDFIKGGDGSDDIYGGHHKLFGKP